MARWSDAMKLSEYREFRDYLDGFCGCYEIGHVKAAVFYTKYVGRAENLWDRIKTYMDESRCHNDYIIEKLKAERHTLWFHVIKTGRYKYMEAKLQDRHGIGETGLYIWNQRVEHAYLTEPPTPW
jgi:hypothetical protein